jgi:hypothetical protein
MRFLLLNSDLHGLIEDGTEFKVHVIIGQRTRDMVGDIEEIFEWALARYYWWFSFDSYVQRYVKITHDPFLFSVAQGIF